MGGTGGGGKQMKGKEVCMNLTKLAENKNKKVVTQMRQPSMLNTSVSSLRLCLNRTGSAAARLYACGGGGGASARCH